MGQALLWETPCLFASTVVYRFFNEHDFYNAKASLESETWKLHQSDGASVHAFAEQNRSSIVLYQQQVTSPRPEGGLRDVTPFIIAISQPQHQQPWALDLGHGRPLFMDGTFGTNRLMVSALGCMGGGCPPRRFLAYLC